MFTTPGFVFIFVLAALIKDAGFLVSTWRNNSSDVSNKDFEVPHLISGPEYYRVEKGGTARLDCDIRQLGGLVKVWKNGTRVVFVGEIKIRNDDRMSLDGSHMVIQGVTIWDSGGYYCEVETDIDQPITLKHNLQVLDPPVLEEVGERQLTSIYGSTISLSCRANGQPKPNITWSREEKRSEILGHGPELTLTHIGRLDAGHYKCSASNGVGEPVSKAVYLTVQYILRYLL